VVGNPGKIVRLASGERPDDLLEHGKLPDPVAEVVRHLDNRITALATLMMEKQCFTKEEFSRQHMQEEENYVESYLEQDPEGPGKP
jgi:serine O-acetyltransferase